MLTISWPVDRRLLDVCYKLFVIKLWFIMVDFWNSDCWLLTVEYCLSIIDSRMIQYIGGSVITRSTGTIYEQNSDLCSSVMRTWCQGDGWLHWVDCYRGAVKSGGVVRSRVATFEKKCGTWRDLSICGMRENSRNAGQSRKMRERWQP